MSPLDMRGGRVTLGCSHWALGLFDIVERVMIVGGSLSESSDEMSESSEDAEGGEGLEREGVGRERVEGERAGGVGVEGMEGERAGGEGVERLGGEGVAAGESGVLGSREGVSEGVFDGVCGGDGEIGGA